MCLCVTLRLMWNVMWELRPKLVVDKSSSLHTRLTHQLISRKLANCIKCTSERLHLTKVNQKSNKRKFGKTISSALLSHSISGTSLTQNIILYYSIALFTSAFFRKHGTKTHTQYIYIYIYIRDAACSDEQKKKWKNRNFSDGNFASSSKCPTVRRR